MKKTLLMMLLAFSSQGLLASWLFHVPAQTIESYAQLCSEVQAHPKGKFVITADFHPAVKEYELCEVDFRGSIDGGGYTVVLPFGMEKNSDFDKLDTDQKNRFLLLLLFSQITDADIHDLWVVTNPASYAHYHIDSIVKGEHQQLTHIEGRVA